MDKVEFTLLGFTAKFHCFIPGRGEGWEIIDPDKQTIKYGIASQAAARKFIRWTRNYRKEHTR